MTIWLRTLQGTFDFKMEPSDTVEDFKVMIWDKTGETPDFQSLIFGGGILKDGRTLADHNIKNECTLTLVIRRGR